jgi:splicing factor 3B subunit 5
MDPIQTFVQLDQLQSSYLGTGNADTTRQEWFETQQRDTYASFIGHKSMQRFIALAKGESMHRVQYDCYEKLVQPPCTRNEL